MKIRQSEPQRKYFMMAPVAKRETLAKMAPSYNAEKVCEEVAEIDTEDGTRFRGQ